MNIRLGKAGWEPFVRCARAQRTADKARALAGNLLIEYQHLSEDLVEVRQFISQLLETQHEH